MGNLQERLLKLTIANTVKKSTTTSINHLILRVLQEKNEKLTRPELVARISEIRYNDSHTSPITEKDLEKPEVLEEFLKIVKTVKNGVDTSISKSNNNSSFSFNPEFKAFELCEEAGKYFIKSASVKK